MLKDWDLQKQAESQRQVRLHQWPFVRVTITTFSLYALLNTLSQSASPQHLLLSYCPSVRNDSAMSFTSGICFRLPPDRVVYLSRIELARDTLFPFLLFADHEAGDEILQVACMFNRRLSVQLEKKLKNCWKNEISVWDCSWRRNFGMCRCDCDGNFQYYRFVSTGTETSADHAFNWLRWPNQRTLSHNPHLTVLGLPVRASSFSRWNAIVLLPVDSLEQLLIAFLLSCCQKTSFWNMWFRITSFRKRRTGKTKRSITITNICGKSCY